MDKKKLGWITFFFILLGCSFASIWLTDLSAEQLLFNLHVSLKGVNNKQCGVALFIVRLFLQCRHFGRCFGAAAVFAGQAASGPAGALGGEGAASPADNHCGCVAVMFSLRQL